MVIVINNTVSADGDDGKDDNNNTKSADNISGDDENN